MAATRARTTRDKSPADVLAAIADLSEHINSNFATKSYVDSETAKIGQEIGKLRVEMVTRDDIRRLETSISEIKLSIAGQVSMKADVMNRAELELRFKPIETSLTKLDTSLAAMNTLADNRLWDVIKTVLPWVIMGLGVATAAAGHIQLH